MNVIFFSFRQLDDLDLELEPDVQNVQGANQIAPQEERPEAGQSDNQRQDQPASDGEEQENVDEAAQEAEAAPAVGDSVELVGQLRVAEEEKTQLQKVSRKQYFIGQTSRVTYF